MIEKIIYLGIGILTEILITLYYILVGKRSAFRASLVTIVITLLNFFIIEKIVVSIDWIGILFYALGSAIGCFTLLKISKYINKKKIKKQ